MKSFSDSQCDTSSHRLHNTQHSSCKMRWTNWSSQEQILSLPERLCWALLKPGSVSTHWTLCYNCQDSFFTFIKWLGYRCLSVEEIFTDSWTQTISKNCKMVELQRLFILISVNNSPVLWVTDALQHLKGRLLRQKHQDPLPIVLTWQIRTLVMNCPNTSRTLNDPPVTANTAAQF